MKKCFAVFLLALLCVGSLDARNLRGYPNGSGATFACTGLPASGAWDSSTVSPYTPPNGTPSYTFTNRPMAVAVDPFTPTTVWLFVSTNGLFKSTNCGAAGSWTLVSTGTNSSTINSGTGWSMHLDTNSGRAGTIYLTSGYNTGSVGIYKSTDYGVDWTELSIGSNPTLSAFFWNNIDMDSSNTLHLVTSTHGTTSVSGYTNGAIAESFDGGATWPNIVQMPVAWGEDGGPQIIPGTIGSGGANTSTWIWGTGDGETGTYLTTNSGASWTQPFTGAYDSANGEWSIPPGLVAASNGQYYVSAIGAILTSSGAGTTWTEAWGTLNFSQALLQSNVIATGSTIYAGGNQTMYSSALGSSAWAAMTSQPPGLVSGQDNVGWLAYSGSNGVLYMATAWNVLRYTVPVGNR